MAKINLILDNRRKKKDNTYPIKIFVRHKKSMAYIATKYSIEEKYWDNGRIKRGCSTIENIRLANNKLATMLCDADDYLDELEQKNRLDHLNAKQIANFIKNGGKNRSASINLIEYLENYTKIIQNRSTREKYKNTLVQLKKYIGNDLLFFDDITKSWLNRYKEYRLENSSASTTNIDLRNIRSIFNRAIDVDEIVGQEEYPFRRFSFVEITPRNLRLTLEQIKQIRDFKSSNKYIEAARDFFMLSFFLIGANNSDIYDTTQIIDGRIEYSRNKTKKQYSIKVEPEAMEIIERRKGKNTFLIYQEKYKSSRTLTAVINQQLKEIGKAVNIPNLIMYHARHSWAGISAKKPIGASKALIAQALGHGKTTVTDTYFDYDNELVDDLNRKVLDRLLE